MNKFEKDKVAEAISILEKAFNSPIYSSLGEPYYAVCEVMGILDELLYGENK